MLGYVSQFCSVAYPYKYKNQIKSVWKVHTVLGGEEKKDSNFLVLVCEHRTRVDLHT